MTPTFSWPALLSVLAGVTSLFIVRWLWGFRGRPGAVHMTGAQLAIAVWGLAYGGALMTFDPALRPLFEPVIWLTRSVTPPLVLLFALHYTGRDHLVTGRFRAALLGFWGFAFLFHVTNAVHQLSWTGYRVEPVFGAAAVTFTPKLGLYFFSAAAWVFTGAAVILILGPLVSNRRLFGRQAVAILVVLTFPTVANVAWLLRLEPTRHLDLTPLMFLVTVAAVSYALFREELFELLPATTQVANDIAIDDINAVVLTLSPNGRLIDLNEEAAALFGLDPSAALGRPMEEALPVDLPLESTEFTVSDPGGHNREFDVDVSPIQSTTGDLVGHVVTLYDITGERRRQQRLAVQNRILRHNLRNGLAVVDGNAERIGQLSADDEVAPLVETIRETSDELMRVGEKVRRFDAALSDDPGPVDVARLCRDVVDDLADRYPEATVEFEANGTADVETRRRLLQAVLEEAIENGVVHATGDRPRVGVRLATAADQVTIAVEDDGPGIPPDEVEALKDGDEDPLSHGSSIGLWIVEWGTSVLGGSVTFETGESGGTTVSVRLPRQ